MNYPLDAELRAAAKHKMPAELHEVAGACHGFERALESRITASCMERRIAWARQLWRV